MKITNKYLRDAIKNQLKILSEAAEPKRINVTSTQTRQAGPDASGNYSMKDIYTGTTGTYTVKRGDTLYALAKKWGVTLKDIAIANPDVTNLDAIEVGSKLNKPSKGKGPGPKPSPTPTPPPSPTPTPPPPTPAPPPPRTTPSCDLRKRKNDPARVVQITKELIEIAKSIVSGGTQVLMTYAAKIVQLRRELGNLSMNGQVAEVYASQQFLSQLKQTATEVSTKITGKEVGYAGYLASIDQVAKECGGQQDQVVTTPVPDLSKQSGSANFSQVTFEGKTVFTKSYVQQVIREELQKVKKKIK